MQGMFSYTPRERVELVRVPWRGKTLLIRDKANSSSGEYSVLGWLVDETRAKKLEGGLVTYNYVLVDKKDQRGCRNYLRRFAEGVYVSPNTRIGFEEVVRDETKTHYTPKNGWTTTHDIVRGIKFSKRKSA